MANTTNSTNNTIGSSTTTDKLNIVRSASGEWIACNDQTDEFGIYNNAGTPESVVAADTGSICTDTTKANLYIKTTDTVSTGWSLIANSGINSINVQTFTASGTYTPTAGMAFALVEVVGGGGGSGGCAASAANQCSIGEAGNGGGYARAILTSAQVGASQTVTIGTGGAAGASGTNPGGTGGTTSFGTLFSATGGQGGAGGFSAPNSLLGAGMGGIGTAGSITPDIIYRGCSASPNTAVAGIGVSGSGGGSFYSGDTTCTAGGGPFPATKVGDVGNFPGGGAEGSASFGSSSGTVAVVGGQGAAGVCIITEYISS